MMSMFECNMMSGCSESKRVKNENMSDNNFNNIDEDDNSCIDVRRSDSLMQALFGMQRRGDMCDFVMVPIGDDLIQSHMMMEQNLINDDISDLANAKSNCCKSIHDNNNSLANAIRIHSVVAAVASPFLSSMISQMNMAEYFIELPCEIDALQTIVNYMYTGNLELGKVGNSSTLVMRVKKLAKYLHMQSVIIQCQEFLQQIPSTKFELRKTLKGHSSYIYDICMCGNNNKFIASGSRDQSIMIWDIASGDMLKEIREHRDRVFALLPLRYDNNNNSTNSNIIGNNTGNSKNNGMNRSNHASNSGGSDKLVSASWDFTVKVWDTETWTLEQTLEGHKGWVTALANIGNKYLISGSADATIRVYDMLESETSWTNVKVLQGHSKTIYSLVGIAPSLAHPNGLIISGSEDFTIRVWDAQTWECLHVLKEHNGAIRSLSVFGEHILSGSSDSTIKIWNISNGKCEMTIKEHKDWVENLCILDSRRIASSSRDGTIKIWKIGTWECLQTLTGHSHWVYALALMNDGSLISASADTTIKVWTQDDSAISSNKNRIHFGSPPIKSIATISENQSINELRAIKSHDSFQALFTKPKSHSDSFSTKPESRNG